MAAIMPLTTLIPLKWALILLLTCLGNLACKAYNKEIDLIM